MTFERLLFVFRFSRSPFNVLQTKLLPVETLRKKKNKQANKMPKHHRVRFLKYFTFYVSFSAIRCQITFITSQMYIFYHYLNKSHITYIKISSTNSFLLNLNPRKHSF